MSAGMPAADVPGCWIPMLIAGELDPPQLTNNRAGKSNHGLASQNHEKEAVEC
jgi:hypothetical protein